MCALPTKPAPITAARKFTEKTSIEIHIPAPAGWDRYAFRFPIPGSGSPRCRLLDPWNHRRINPGVVLSFGYIGKQPPALDVFDHFARLQFDQRSQAFQLDEVRVGENLEIAAAIGILCTANDWRTLHEQATPPEIRSPAGRVVDPSHLLPETALGICQLSQLNIGSAEHPTSVGKVSVRPDGEDSGSRIELYG